MHPIEARTELPVIFCLHNLGGSGREWDVVAAALAPVARCVAIDLPGFGEASGEPGYAVADMAAFVAGKIANAGPRRWAIAGHSMGAKVAALLLREIEDGERRLDGLVALIVVAGSPPGPEPMEESQRQKMLGWFRGDAATSRAEARGYVEENSASDLSADSIAVCVDDVLRTNRDAWVAWLERGSREDLSRRVGVVQTPALIIAGADDPQLGPEAQRKHAMPHYANVRLAALGGAKHLLPLERPDEVARLMAEHLSNAAYLQLIASSRVSSKTREALLERDAPDDPDYEPSALQPNELATLRALMDVVIPQDGVPIDLAARIDKKLASGGADGWRFAALPADAAAYQAGLATLDVLAEAHYGRPFAQIDGAGREALLASIASGAVADHRSDATLDAEQMRLWFEDVRADAVEVYVSHPRTFARIGYSGIAYGGDGEPKSGFARVGLGERESWEPVAAERLR